MKANRPLRYRVTRIFFILFMLWILPPTLPVLSTSINQPVIFRYRLATDPPTLDPALSTDTTSGTVILKIHDGLVQFDPETLEVIPAVARSWDVSPDGLRYTFYLRDDVRFHNGRRVTAHDVKTSFERVLNPATRSGRTFVLEPLLGSEAFMNRQVDHIEGITVLDDMTVSLVLKEPFSPFLAQLCMEAASIIPIEECGSGETTFSSRSVGCGPFVFRSWKHDVEVILEKNPDYYGNKPSIDRIEFRIIQSVPTAFEEYKADGLDMLDQIPTGQIQALRKTFADEIRIWPYLSIYYIGLNLDRLPFKDNVKLRQAMNHAVDREKMCRAIKEGLAYPIAGVLPPGIPGHDPDLTGYTYDPERATQLLAEAGYPGGEGLPVLTLWHNRDPRHGLIGQCIQYYLGRIGVRIRLKNVEWAAYIEAVDEAEPDLFRMGWVADYPDADNFLFTLLHSSQFGSAGNYARFSHPEFDRLTSEAKRITDRDVRLALYREAERIAIEQAPWIFIYYERELAMIKPRWDNIILTPQGDFAIPLERVRLKETRQ
ncbi:ABC transporter substrate-binding protein [bacterium]|nr:ABC transporter substrate-binding protein [candidate division CSSED10-310 bacterium]